MTTTDNPTVGDLHSSPAWPDAESTTADLATGSPSLDQAPSLFVRPFSLRDIPKLVRFPGTLRLDAPDSLVIPQSNWFGLPAALPVLRRERPIFVALADGDPVGFLRISPRRPDGRWVVYAIAATTGVD